MSNNLGKQLAVDDADINILAEILPSQIRSGGLALERQLTDIFNRRGLKVSSSELDKVVKNIQNIVNQNLSVEEINKKLRKTIVDGLKDRLKDIKPLAGKQLLVKKNFIEPWSSAIQREWPAIKTPTASTAKGKEEEKSEEENPEEEKEEEQKPEERAEESEAEKPEDKESKQPEEGEEQSEQPEEEETLKDESPAEKEQKPEESREKPEGGEGATDGEKLKQPTEENPFEDLSGESPADLSNKFNQEKQAARQAAKTAEKAGSEAVKIGGQTAKVGGQAAKAAVEGTKVAGQVASTAGAESINVGIDAGCVAGSYAIVPLIWIFIQLNARLFVSGFSIIPGKPIFNGFFPSLMNKTGIHGKAAKFSKLSIETLLAPLIFPEFLLVFLVDVIILVALLVIIIILVVAAGAILGTINNIIQVLPEAARGPVRETIIENAPRVSGWNF